MAVSPLRETARQRRRRIAAEEQRWADEAYAEYLRTDEGSQVCRWIAVPAEPAQDEESRQSPAHYPGE